MTEPRWLDRDIVVALHQELIAEHGGLGGIRDEGLLDSALGRPRNLHAYEVPSLFELAAAHGFGLALNHPFIDGNKRTALVAADVFLQMNGLEIVAAEVEIAATFRDLAAGEIDERTLAAWIEANSEKISP